MNAYIVILEVVSGSRRFMVQVDVLSRSEMGACSAAIGKYRSASAAFVVSIEMVK